MNYKHRPHSLPPTFNGTHINGYKSDYTEEKEILRRLRIQNTKLNDFVIICKEKIAQSNADKKKIISEVAHIQKLNQLLSQALGSCPKCWGEDPTCSNCSGEGIAGWQKINKRLFNSYVLPAVDKVYHLGKRIK